MAKRGKKKKDTERIPEWRVLEATARTAKWKRTFLMNFKQLGWIAFETHWNIFKYRHCHEVFWTFRKPLCQWCPTSMGQWEQSGKQHNTMSLCVLYKNFFDFLVIMNSIGLKAMRSWHLGSLQNQHFYLCVKQLLFQNSFLLCSSDSQKIDGWKTINMYAEMSLSHQLISKLKHAAL